MRRIRFVLVAFVVCHLAGFAWAQSEIAGKVLDMESKPVAGAEVTAANTTFPERVFKGTSDKKGNFLVTGLMYETSAQSWNVSIKAAGFIPVSVKTVARDSQKNLYLQDDTKFSPAKPSMELKD